MAVNNNVMAIRSPKYSFVDFNPEVLDCVGETRQASLPVYDNFGIKFQFKVEDELLPINTVFYAAACSADCDLIYDPNEQAMPICERHKFMYGSNPLLVSDFPIQVQSYTSPEPVVPAGTYDLSAFLDILGTTFEANVPGLDFIQCCEIPEITDIPVVLAGGGSATISLNSYYATGYVDFPATSLNSHVDAGECFRYCILSSTKEVLACSNLFYREVTECFTSILRYYNEENAYGFQYMSYEDGGVTRFTENTIRLPFYFRKPIFPVTERIVRLSNGLKQRTSTVVGKDFMGTVGPLSVEQHEKLVMALKHDYTFVTNTFSGVDYRMTQEGEYTPDYPDINTPLSPAEFRMSDTSQNNVNNNCGFNCGVDLVDSCEGGGGVTNPCPEPFQVEFEVLADSQPTYQNSNLIGKTDKQIEVYREGIIQYTIGDNYFSINSGTGTITFVPALGYKERVSIWTV